MNDWDVDGLDYQILKIPPILIGPSGEIKPVRKLPLCPACEKTERFPKPGKERCPICKNYYCEKHYKEHREEHVKKS